MKIVFIVPTSRLRRFLPYRLCGSFYGHSNSITGPLILGGILKEAGHQVEVYEELYTTLNYRKIMPGTDVFCLYSMTSTAPRCYELADKFHRETRARVLIGGFHASALPEEALTHADQVLVGEGEKVILDVVEGRLTDPIVRGPLRGKFGRGAFSELLHFKNEMCNCQRHVQPGLSLLLLLLHHFRMFRPYPAAAALRVSLRS